jgi:hypothetical protein
MPSMERRTLGFFAFALPITLLALSACSDDTTGATGGFTSAANTESAGDGDGDGNSATETAGNSMGDGDGDTQGDGDGDGDGDTQGDGDGDTQGDGDGDGEPGDGDGDGDGDTGDPPCMSEADCADPNNPVCDLDTGECVPCTPAEDVCDIGQYCDDTNNCVVGCLNDLDCPNELVCDVNNNTCTGCVEDMNCPLGSVCELGDCVPGCTDQQPCQDGFSCCGDTCQDLVNDPNNCGMCDFVCPDYPNAEDLCNGGTCGLGPCIGNWNNCDGQPMNGCETQAQCLCQPGEQIDCYTGFPADTEGVGTCQSGTRTCNNNGTGYGACIGQVIPQLEICNSGADENCNGQVDENPDLDNDGWGVCDNDCCDQVNPDCSTPNLVNPGAFEFPGNVVDDNCDGMIDNALALCDGGLASNDANPLNYARAIDLCQFTTENPALPQKKWGVISGNFFLASGAGVPSANSRSIRAQFGTNVLPQAGQRLAVLSSGYASYPGQANPAYVAFQTGIDTGTFSASPADWLQANGGAIPNAPGCVGPGSTTAYNPMMLKLRVRVPTNANSFSTKMFFYSAEYPEYTCTAFNDMVLTLVDSSDNGNPNDKNIAIYTTMNNQEYPIGVNLVKAAAGLFSQCTNGVISQCGVPSNYNGCTGTNLLTGTGFNVAAAACGYNGNTGGGTGWLTMSGNVTPGETMEIRFIIFDIADGVWDSLVLFDNWQWSVQAAQPGVTPG